MDNDADKRIVLGSDRPSEGIATSLRFPSKTGSFPLDKSGKEAEPADEQPDSPIKTSPVSERIKALEALVAQRSQPDFRSDRGFFHVRDHHSEKSSTEKITPFEKIPPTKTTREISDKQPPPDSLTEVLEDFNKMNEYEETEEWMKEHLPPVPTFDVVNLMKCNFTSDFAPSEAENGNDKVISNYLGGDSDVDSPGNPLKQQQSQPSAEERLESLPPADSWEQTETSVVDPAPDSNSAEQKPACSGDGDPPEVSEAESSESEDTVIEDGLPVHSESFDIAVSVDGTDTRTSSVLESAEIKDVPPPTFERKLMQVPTINVIETDEQQYSDEEMDLEPEEVEDYEEGVKEHSSEVSKSKEPDSEDSENELTGTCPTETDFIEVYSPPSSPAGSDTEPSPEHQVVEGPPKNFASNQDHLSDPTMSAPDVFQTPPVNKEISSKNEKNNFVDDDHEWSGDQGVQVTADGTDTQTEKTSLEDQGIKAAKEVDVRRSFVSLSSLMQEDFYERQSFDSDYGVSSALDCLDGTEQISAKERFLSGSSQVMIGELSSCAAKKEACEDNHNMEDFLSPKEDEGVAGSVTQATFRDGSQDLSSNSESNEVAEIHEQDFSEISSPHIVCEKNENLFLSDWKDVETQQDTKEDCFLSDDKSTSPTDSKNLDSFLDFMRECLKSQQDEEEEEEVQDETQCGDFNSKQEHVSPSHFTPTVVMNLEQEKLTINLLKELGSSQEEELVSLPTEVPGQEDMNPTFTSVTPSPLTSVSEPAQSHLALDSTYCKGVEAIDKWVAEAYHLTEHVLNAILTHLTGNPSFCHQHHFYTNDCPQTLEV